MKQYLDACHIYVNQIDGIKEQLEREPKRLPYLLMTGHIKSLEDVETWVDVKDFSLVEYEHHPAIKFPFAV